MFTNTSLVTADSIGVCSICRVPFFPGEILVREDDFVLVHPEHSSISEEDLLEIVHA